MILISYATAVIWYIFDIQGFFFLLFIIIIIGYVIFKIHSVALGFGEKFTQVNIRNRLKNKDMALNHLLKEAKKYR